MRKSKRMIYWGIFLILIVLIDSVLIKHLYSENLHLQSKMESNLPQKINLAESGYIRVLIKSNGFKEITHPEVKIQSNTGLIVETEEETKEYAASEVLIILPDDEKFQNGTIRIRPQNENDKITIQSLQRGYGIPSYRGTLELYQTAEGIVIVNELLQEQYLYAVVPSEMPASYEAEALKAQAVCARSYAYNQSREHSYPEYKAHVDDSTSFQVYGNSKEQESTRNAVNETAGEKIWYKNQVATTYYYSTSCGKSTSIRAWGTEFNEYNQYLKSIELCDEEGNAYESSLPWYQWSAVIPATLLENLLELNTGVEIGKLQSVSITELGDGGVVQQITAVGDGGNIVVETENKIRKALGGEGYEITKQDGTVIKSTTLLPSAFFTISQSDEKYIINGGGYGHGIGMSQNGANEMAKAGKTYREILTTFYSGVEIK